MKILIAGRNKSGSFIIRGQQLGVAIGASVIRKPTLAELQAHDAIVWVKRLDEDQLRLLRESGKPWIWDTVDSFPQPACSAWGRSESIRWARDELELLRPSAVIWPNHKMQQDVDWNGQQIVLKHHGRPGQAVNPIRERVQTVGYEGSPRYLSDWHGWLESSCKARGWRFVVNPEMLSECDIVVAVRGQGWNGYPQREWKSNVKLGNAQITGTPVIAMPESGYLENACGREYFVTSKAECEIAFDWLTPHETRTEVSKALLASAPRIEEIAQGYRTWLRSLRF